MTLDDLLELMPASVKEIEGYLEAIRAIELNGMKCVILLEINNV